MTFDEIPVLYRQAWSVYEALRRLGFKDDDVVYRAAQVALPHGGVTKEEHLLVVLAAQDKEFIVVLNPVDRSVEEASTLWERIRIAIGEGAVTDETMAAMWAESKMADPDYFTSFSAALVMHGFMLPALAN